MIEYCLNQYFKRPDVHTPILPTDISQTVKVALAEDIGDGDKTAALLEPNTVTAKVISRESAILCGCAWFDEVFRQLDAQVSIQWHYRDGDNLDSGTELCELHGPVTSILTGERTALNFLQTLSATATLTYQYVQAVSGTKARILDTRKTIPGLRTAQKYAVTCGGGMNHRMGLFDAILIKENHIAAAGSIRKAVHKAREQSPNLFVEIEVENIEELEQALDSGPDRILLDNFSIDQLKSAVSLNSGCNQLEASGNITLDNIKETASTGVDYVSIGSLTKNIQAIDLSLLID